MATKSRTRFRCMDCGEDTGKIHEFYFVQTELWFGVVGSTHGMLCIGCLENRLNRRLCRSDFTDCFLNDPNRGVKSARFLDRLLN